MIYLQLFISFFKVGLFSFGGGYGALPLIQNEIVKNHHWLSLDDFTNLITISQMTPGPIAINSATFVGIKVGGLLGGIIATLGCILPPFIIISILIRIYYKYKNINSLNNVLTTLRPAVAAMIWASAFTITLGALWNLKAITLDNLKINIMIIFIISIILCRKTKISPILIILIGGGLNLICYATKHYL